MLRDSSQPSHKAMAGQATSRLRQATARQALGMTKGINHEAHDGKEFSPENGATVCHTIVTWQLSRFSL